MSDNFGGKCFACKGKGYKVIQWADGSKEEVDCLACDGTGNDCTGNGYYEKYIL